jgi:hypothetical protein
MSSRTPVLRFFATAARLAQTNYRSAFPLTPPRHAHDNSRMFKDLGKAGAMYFPGVAFLLGWPFLAKNLMLKAGI